MVNSKLKMKRIDKEVLCGRADSAFEFLNCTKLFKFLCPKEWKNLERTSDDKVRYCKSCQKNVQFCTTREEVQRRSGNCIAIRLGDIDEDCMVQDMGETSEEYIASLTKQDESYRKR